MEKIGIIGYGFVGKATHKGLLQYQEVIKHDVKYNTDISILKNCDILFFCIPTDDQKDIEKLIKEIKDIKNINSTCTVVVRSTVPIGTCKLIEEEIQDSILYIPEFLRERFWETDCEKRPIIIGNNSAEIPEFLIQLEHKICLLEEAELLKMFSNNYATLRVAFANIFYDISQKIDADYHVVKDLFLQVQQNQTYLEVPGPDGKRGFGGKCLPKDLDFLIETLNDLNIDSSLFKIIKDSNTIWNNSKY